MQNRNQPLDILRGIAVLMVVVSHYTVVLPGGSALLDTGSVGVDLFFVLSGFLISGLLFSEFKKTGTIDVKRFWIRRGFKIYPSFYTLIGLTIFVAVARTHRLPRELIHEAVFLQNYLPRFWFHTWSLAVEEHFYLFLPVLLLILSRVGKNTRNPFRVVPIISIGLSIICLYGRIVALRHGANWDQIAFPTHLRIDALFAGVALGYYAHFNPESFRDAGKPWVLALGVVFAASLVVMPDVPRLTFAYVVFTLIVAWAVNGPASKNPLARVLAWIGYYSYSIYLWQVIPMLGLEHLPDRWFRFPTYAVATIAFGVVMAKTIEIPALKVRDKMFPVASQVKPIKEIGKEIPIQTQLAAAREGVRNLTPHL